MRQLVVLLIPLTLVVGGIAIWKGRDSEKISGAALIATLVIQVACVTALKAFGVPLKAYAPILDVGICIALAGVFLHAAMKRASAWLGLACMIQASELAVSATFVGKLDHDGQVAYFDTLNAMSAAILLVVLASTVEAIRRRKNTRKTRSKPCHKATA